EYDWPYIKIEVKCSTGTYIRALAHDIGAKLGCGGYCEELRRTKIGEYNIDNAETIS
ncbi:tRNA pseudouridine(55) synthase, partial [Patescibacteria group bacterium]|nr:tRNA pseudouridine(55) synthase [Patescibacteria group bacterium]